MRQCWRCLRTPDWETPHSALLLSVFQVHPVLLIRTRLQRAYNFPSRLAGRVKTVGGTAPTAPEVSLWGVCSAGITVCPADQTVCSVKWMLMTDTCPSVATLVTSWETQTPLSLRRYQRAGALLWTLLWTLQLIPVLPQTDWSTVSPEYYKTNW